MSSSEPRGEVLYERPEALLRTGAACLGRLLPEVQRGGGALWTDSVIAIESLLLLAASYPSTISNPDRELLASNRLPWLLKIQPEAADRAHPQGSEERPLGLLRRAVLVSAMAAGLAWSPREGDVSQAGLTALGRFGRAARPRMDRQADALATAALQHLPANASPLHPYIGWRVLRALRAAAEFPPAKTSGAHATDAAKAHDAFVERLQAAETRVWTELETYLDVLLARHQLGLVNSAENVALAFGASASGLRTDGRRHSEAAVRACLQASDAATSFADGRVIAREVRGTCVRRLAVPTFEVFWAIGEALLSTLHDRTELLACSESVLKALSAGVELANNTVLPDSQEPPGWSGEQLLGRGGPEIWPTASVLNFAATARRIADLQARTSVLDRYHAVPTWGDDWPKWLRWDGYWQTNEPDGAANILQFIHEEIVVPRQPGPLNRRSDPVVVLLFGPPGTTKTTIARGVANGLGWPLVNLSPGDFLNEGLETIEKRAAEVFADLHRLSQAVVILDESDELFRERRPVPESESVRGVAAFITASMLPRLQDLHDRGRVVLFICTNFLKSIDPAMRRIGRVDYIIAVPPPDEPQRLSIIARELKLHGVAQRRGAPVAAQCLAEYTPRFIRGELVAAARDLASRIPLAGWKDETARSRARAIAADREPTIALHADSKKPPIWDPFVEDMKVLSEPHRRASRSSW